MLKDLLGAIWRRLPRRFRLLYSRIAHPRFIVSVGGVVIDDYSRVLLLNHVFRAGSGWGIPGGFLEAGEQPEEALRRELREEVGLELESTEIVFARTLRGAGQIEIVFRCQPSGEAHPRSIEVTAAAWFRLEELPESLSRDQRSLIERALSVGAEAPV